MLTQASFPTVALTCPCACMCTCCLIYILSRNTANSKVPRVTVCVCVCVLLIRQHAATLIPCLHYQKAATHALELFLAGLLKPKMHANSSCHRSRCIWLRSYPGAVGVHAQKIENCARGKAETSPASCHTLPCAKYDECMDSRSVIDPLVLLLTLITGTRTLKTFLAYHQYKSMKHIQ